jgi:hypothetical protein
MNKKIEYFIAVIIGSVVGATVSTVIINIINIIRSWR